MRFSLYTFVAAALAAVARAGSITFQSLDDQSRDIICTPNAGSPSITTVTLSGLGTNLVVDIPYGWMGNCYAVTIGSPDVPGILVEVAFNQWGGLTFFDASAIVNPNDYVGIKMVFPTADPGNNSGCNSYETQCNNAYNLPDDEQTKSTLLQDFTVTVGVPPQNYQRRHTRDFVLGTHTRAAAADAQ